MPEIPRTYERSHEPVEGDWFLVHCKPRSEKLALANLERQGYTHYFPEILTCVRTVRGWQERISPLFPRYLFVRVFTGHQALAPVRSTLGVTDVVRFGGRYARVPRRVIAALQARADALTGLHRVVEGSPLVRGVPVRIVSGMFDGLEGIFVRSSGTERVVVLLDLLGASSQVRLPDSCVEASDARIAWASC
jgi:transcriptional antiterminator RfaH